MSLLMPFIIGPAPHLSTAPPAFGDLAVVNSFCALALVLCLLGIHSLGQRLTSRLPLTALITTLVATGITFGVNVFYARYAHEVITPWPSHLHPLGSVTFTSSFTLPFKVLYGCTVAIICATAIQVVSTSVLLVRHRGTKSPAIT